MQSVACCYGECEIVEEFWGYLFPWDGNSIHISGVGKNGSFIHRLLSSKIYIYFLKYNVCFLRRSITFNDYTIKFKGKKK